MRDDRPAIAILCGGGLTHTAGGIGRLTAYLLDAWALEPDGMRRIVIDTRGSGGRIGGVAAFAGAFVRLAGLRAAGRLALLHANMSTRGSAVRKCVLCRAAQLTGLPTVMHMHGADLHEFWRAQNRPFRAFMRATLQGSSQVIVLGAFWRDFLVNEVGVASELVSVVPNGVPAPPGRRRAADDVARTETRGVARIAFLGRLGERKGVPELLAALAGLDRDHAWRATLAGDGAVEPFRRETERLGLLDRVCLPGWLDRRAASALLGEADIFVLPSHHEGMPLALLEALAHGVAVVATAVGSNGEFLRHGENALLVPPGDPVALTEAIARLIDDAAMRRRLGGNGRATFDERLAIGAVAARIASIHQRAIRNGALRRPTRRERSA